MWKFVRRAWFWSRRSQRRRRKFWRSWTWFWLRNCLTLFLNIPQIKIQKWNIPQSKLIFLWKRNEKFVNVFKVKWNIYVMQNKLCQRKNWIQNFMECVKNEIICNKKWTMSAQKFNWKLLEMCQINFLLFIMK